MSENQEDTPGSQDAEVVLPFLGEEEPLLPEEDVPLILPEDVELLPSEEEEPHTDVDSLR
jgi:hypothetical protein